MASKNKLAFDELLHFISKSTKNKSTILTANQRQTRMLKEQVAHASLTHAAQNLRIMSLTNWVNELWLDAIDHGSLSNNTGEKLLSEFEDTLIWEK